jgi:hypothetical protein
MSIPRDFKLLTTFRPEAIRKGGVYIGSNLYWKLYFIENLYRILIHSILSAQIQNNWWSIAVDPKIQKRATNFKSNYQNKPWHTLPGQHDIYYVFLSDLNDIVRANSHLFITVVPDINNWIVKIEDISLPRNVVAHMNFPNRQDGNRIDVVYNDIKTLLASLISKSNSSPTAVAINVPK